MLTRLFLFLATAAPVLTCGAAATLVQSAGAPAPAPTAVDLALVLAVDASGSISPDRWDLERQGYAAAFRDPTVVTAIQGGAVGAIAVTLVEWSAQFQQSQVVGWMVVSDADSAARFANAVARIPHLYRSWTSISSGISYSGRLLESAPYGAERQVIDVSGDGPDSSSQRSILGTAPDLERLVEARDFAVKQGYVINGLPIFGDPQLGAFPLDNYYAMNVIGGPGAFEIVAQDFTVFSDAVRRKLILEIAAMPKTEPGPG